MRTFVLLTTLLGCVGLSAQETAPTAASEIDENQLRAGLASITSADTMKKVKVLADDAFEGRNAGYPGCWEAADWIGEQFEALGLQPIGDAGSFFQEFTFEARQGGGRGRDGDEDRKRRGRDELRGPHHATPTTRNVVALWAGSDPVLKDEVVVLGGHYDHVGREGQWNAGSRRGNAKSNDDVWNGADDNASGTAVVIEMAEAFVASGIRPRRSILFVLFSAEEHGLFGSKWYTSHPPVPLEKTAAMLNFDMVGYRKKKSIEVVGVNHASGQALRTAIADALGQVRGLKAELVPWATQGGSDHAPFLQAKVPAVFFFNGLHGDYHTIADEVKLVSGRRMADVAKVGFLSAIALAQLPEKPTFVEAKGAAGGGAILGVELAGAVADDEATGLGLKPRQGGLKVKSVYAGTPAADLGIEPEDVIVALGKDPVERGNEAESLGRAVRALEPGATFHVTVVRAGEKKVLRGRMPK